MRLLTCCVVVALAGAADAADTRKAKTSGDKVTAGDKLYVYDSSGKLVEEVPIPREKVGRTLKDLAEDIVTKAGTCRDGVTLPPNCVACADGQILCNGPKRSKEKATRKDGVVLNRR